MRKKKIYCGSVSIIGRSNVGKSTLLNQLLGKKVSITSHKVQTTRQCIIGIDTKDTYQTIYIDTPGIYVGENHVINSFMKWITKYSISNVELIILVVEGTYWTMHDEMVIKKLQNISCAVLLVINKIDNVIDKTSLLPHILFLSKKMNFLSIVPISAAKGIGIDSIIKIVRQHMPESQHRFPASYITDRSNLFMASEIIREKLMRFLVDELPYSVTVGIEKFIVNACGSYNIYGLIFVAKDGQKKIVVGSKGSKIKKIGIAARVDMEKFFATKVYLELWVKIIAG